MKKNPKELQPNPWNPNVLAAAQFKRLVAELRKRGENLKPVTVREVANGGLEIVDGEWTVRAAIEGGLTEVIVENLGPIDDFEARRLTMVANHHGENDPVKTGLLAQEMLNLRPALEQKDLAEILGVSPATMTNRLAYARLAEAAKTDKSLPPVSEISKMSVRQVKEMLAGIDASKDEEAVETFKARPMEKAKKAFQKLTPDEQALFREWLAQV